MRLASAVGRRRLSTETEVRHQWHPQKSLGDSPPAPVRTWKRIRLPPREDEYEGLPPPPKRRGLGKGFTTGATAAAAARAATLALLTGELQTDSTVDLKEACVRHTFPIMRCEFAPDREHRTGCTCGVIKDGGDDPDATHGAEIQATVSFSDSPGLHLAGGPGVGVATRPGLGLEVGGPAINPIPRIQICREVKAAAAGFFPRLCELVADRSLARTRGAVTVEALLFDFDGNLLGRAVRG